jgi:hypothetical protein
MLEMEQLADLDSEAAPAAICAIVAQLFKVKETKVALLKFSGNLLKFIHPSELQQAGAIPLASSSVQEQGIEDRSRATVLSLFLRNEWLCRR